jgi:hypothetical protein
VRKKIPSKQTTKDNENKEELWQRGKMTFFFGGTGV